MEERFIGPLACGDKPTRDLVDELSQREGVETSTLAPCVEAVIKVSGPAKVLVIID